MRLPKPRSHVKRNLAVRRDDQVAIISGKDRGKRGAVLRVDREKGRVVVAGVNVARRHRKPTQQLLQGGIVEQENPVDVSTVMVVCGSCHQPTRVGSMLKADGRRVRRCVRCGQPLDK